MAAILDHLDKVSVFGPSVVALFLILGLDWVFTGIHTYQEWRGEVAPLWRTPPRTAPAQEPGEALTSYPPLLHNRAAPDTEDRPSGEPSPDTLRICLDAEAPDHPVTTIAIECESEPLQDTDFVRRERPRNTV